MLTQLDAQRELQARAQAELAARRKRPEYAQAVLTALRNDLFDRQQMVLDCPARRISLCCSRRAGKSEVAARMIATELVKAKHNEYVMFAARTLQRARQIIWALLMRINDEYALGWRCKEHTGEIITPEGGVFTLLGVDDAVAIEKVRGSKYRLIFCDEAASYEEHLEKLVLDCAEPGTIDLKGKIVLAGTPGYAKTGYWYEVACGLNTGWQDFYWTLVDNPFISDAEAELKAIRDGHGWDETEPTYRREYLGQWVSDESALVYAFDERKNTVTSLPEPPEGMELDEWIRDYWLTTVAADIGYTDAFAIVTLGSPPHSQDVYVLDVYEKAGLRVHEQCDEIKARRDRYRPARTVADIGGQGKQTQVEFNSRYGHTAGGALLPAVKSGYVESIGMFNSDMRAGKVKAVLPFAAPLVKEWLELPWETEEKQKEHKGFNNHMSSACRYAWRVHRSFQAKPGAAPLTEAQKDDAAAIRRSREAMEAKMARKRSHR